MCFKTWGPYPSASDLSTSSGSSLLHSNHISFTAFIVDLTASGIFGGRESQSMPLQNLIISSNVMYSGFSWQKKSLTKGSFPRLNLIGWLPHHRFGHVVYIISPDKCASNNLQNEYSFVLLGFGVLLSFCFGLFFCSSLAIQLWSWFHLPRLRLYSRHNMPRLPFVVCRFAVSVWWLNEATKKQNQQKLGVDHTVPKYHTEC